MSIGQYFRDYDPFYELKRIRKDMNRYFQYENRRGLTEGDIFNPKIDIKESEGKYMIHAELPGVKKEDLHCWVEGDKLIISGEKKCVKSEENENVHRKEIQYGMFERAFNLPMGVRGGDINCKMENGVLCVCFPKPQSELQGRRSINIEYPTTSDVEGTTYYDDRGLEVPRGVGLGIGLPGCDYSKGKEREFQQDKGRKKNIPIKGGDVGETLYDDRGEELPKGGDVSWHKESGFKGKGRKIDIQSKGGDVPQGKGRNENRPKTEGDIPQDKGSDVPQGKGRNEIDITQGKGSEVLGKGGDLQGKVSDVPQGKGRNEKRSKTEGDIPQDKGSDAPKGKGRNENRPKTEGDIPQDKGSDVPQGKVSDVPQSKGRKENRI